ncbi:MAG: cytochrome P450 [Caulobacteraceae bacterium]|nr:cytochrome P450 [Caulobacteraceae bacterium]
MTAELAPRPAHVPPERVYDFDYYNAPGSDRDVHRAWKRLHEEAPDIFWTPRYGGHWVVTRGEDLELMQMHYDRFSHRKYRIPYDPAMANEPMLPLAEDPPVSTPFRALIAPAFLPKVVARLEEHVRDVAIKAIEEFLPRGECEFVSEFASVLPIVVFLEMMGLPLDNARWLLEQTEIGIRSNSIEKRAAAHAAIKGYLTRFTDERAANPGDDIISKIVAAEIDGRPITHAEVMGVCTLLMAGGLDTVTSMLGFVAWHLARNPEQRRELIEHPELIRNAVEELIRRYGLANNVRMATHDFEYNGVQFKEGEQILIPTALYGLDERKVDDPLKVDFHREFPIPHAAFGNGVHTCPGATLARRELRIFLEEWLKRIPDFQVKPGTTPVTACGGVNTVKELHLSWRAA